MSEEYLIELTDGGVVDINSSTECYPGCETCDYGSSYINEFTVALSNTVTTINIDCMYEYAVSEDFAIKLLTRNVETVKDFSEEEFIKWLKGSIKDKIRKNPYIDDNNAKIEITTKERI